MKKKLLLISFILFVSVCSLYSNEDFAIKITDADGNLKKLITKNEFLNDVTNLITLRGGNEEAINIIITNELQLWQIANQIIEQEVLYIKAVEEGYDKDSDLMARIEKERDNQIVQLYMQKKVPKDFSVVTDAQKRSFYNTNKNRLPPNVTFDQLSLQIEYAIIQERMRNEYNKILQNAKTNYTKFEYSSAKDPCITIEETTIPLSKFNEMFNENLKQAGDNIPPALKAQARDSMFNAFAAMEVMLYDAKKTGFYDTPEAKSLDNLITRNAVTANYIDKTIRAKIPKPTEEEINQAYKQYGAIYKIDSLPYQEAQKALETLVIEAKTQQIYQVLIAQLRYSYSIEKDLSL